MTKTINCPEGLSDVLPEYCKQREKVMKAIKEHLQLCGYHSIATPVIEHYELFCNEDRYEHQEALCKFIDRSGRILALRPDMTISAARLAALNLLPSEELLKLYYCGNVYRVDRQQTKTIELMQIGGEIFGDDGLLSDIESMINPCEALRQSGLDNFRLDIGCTQISKIAVSKLKADKAQKEMILYLMESKRLVELEDVLDKLEEDNERKETIKAIPRLFGKAHDIANEMEKWLKDEEYGLHIEKLKRITAILGDLGYREHLYIDVAMPSLMGYYTGITFCGYHTKVGSPIFSGGRYDRLFEEFGMQEPAVGFAIYIDTLMEVLGTEQTDEEVREEVYYNENDFAACYKRAREQRKNGITATLLPRPKGVEKC